MLDLQGTYDFDIEVNASSNSIIPGFVNLHVHSGFIRGLAKNLPAFEWLTEHVDPTHGALRRDEAHVAYELCYAVMANTGITCTLDINVE